MTATARASWHPPLIAEHIMLSPPAGQLTLSSRHPRREHTDRERRGRSIRAGPMFCCITDCDGRIISRNIPIMMRTTRKFDAPRLMKAIVDHVEYRSFTCTDLKEYADELTHHIKKAEELRAVIGGMTALELGRKLKSIEGENFGGYYVKHEKRETEGVVWRIYPAM